MKYLNFSSTLIFILSSFFVYPQKTTFNVMAPLHIQTYNDPLVLEKKDWEDFRQQLSTVKGIGVEAVTVDVWWGLVERFRDNEFDWSYYKKIVQIVKNSGLHWIPILSFHKCGGNVGDNYTALLPNWIWNNLKNKYDEIESVSDLKYVSEEYNSLGKRKECNEYISLWADDYVMPQYEELIREFKKQFKEYANITDEINISCGPAGELRYPAYNKHDNGGYPNRGRLQCYSKLAVNNFREEIKKKYHTIKKVNENWDTGFISFNDINPPKDPTYFFEHGIYKDSFGINLTNWYNKSLIEHGKRMLDLGFKYFSEEAFSKVKIGIKIPGIHWQIANPEIPRTAEITTGLISSDKNSLTAGNGYENTLKELFKPEYKEKNVLHFTCLEMCNEYYGQNSKDYSKAFDLVSWLGEAAKKNNIAIKGENALEGNLNNNFHWNQLKKVLREGNYSGLTILRISQVADKSKLGYWRYKKIIEEFRSNKTN